MTKIEKNREKLFLAPKNWQKINKQKNEKLSEAKNEPTFRIHQKNREKIIFGSEFSETNNEPTFG